MKLTKNLFLTLFVLSAMSCQKESRQVNIDGAKCVDPTDPKCKKGKDSKNSGNGDMDFPSGEGGGGGEQPPAPEETPSQSPDAGGGGGGGQPPSPDKGPDSSPDGGGDGGGGGGGPQPDKNGDGLPDGSPDGKPSDPDSLGKQEEKLDTSMGLVALASFDGSKTNGMTPRLLLKFDDKNKSNQAKITDIESTFSGHVSASDLKVETTPAASKPIGKLNLKMDLNFKFDGKTCIGKVTLNLNGEPAPVGTKCQ